MDIFDPRVLPICRQILLHKKQSLLNGLFDSADWPDSQPDGDQRQLTFELMESPEESLQLRKQRLLYEIEHALAKIQNGVYGYCERTKKPIDRFRLLSRPWVRYCADHLTEADPTQEFDFQLTYLDAP